MQRAAPDALVQLVNVTASTDPEFIIEASVCRLDASDTRERGTSHKGHCTARDQTWLRHL